jgi:predicted nucleic acid-binding protein
VIVVDACVLANAIGDDAPDRRKARAALAGNDLSVPDLADVEVVSLLRRRWLAKTMTATRFATAIGDLAAVPADRYPGPTSCEPTSAPPTRRTWPWPSNSGVYSSPRTRG